MSTITMTEQERIKHEATLLNQIKILTESGMWEEAEVICRKLEEDGKSPPAIASMRELKKFITSDIDLLQLKERVLKVVRTPYPILIVGETGTGKEIIARALHGNKNPQKFLGINCAAFPEGLLESELFGHVKGAFTGAEGNKPGLMENADTGTLFLDEIVDMSLHLQAKLLRVLQERKFRPVGSNDFKDLKCRVITATNKDPMEQIRKGAFRLDLYYRISTIEFRTKPLRDRPEDVIPILESFVEIRDKRVLEIGKPLATMLKNEYETLTRDSVVSPTSIEDFLTSKKILPCEGNVRELQRMATRYYLFSEL